MNEIGVNKKNRIYFICGLASLALTLLYVGYICMQAKRFLAVSVTSTALNYYILMALAIVTSFFAAKDEKVFTLFVLQLFVFFLWLSFADTSYSPIDESLHFDNINHIINYGTMPTFSDEIDYIYLNNANNCVNAIGPFVNYEAVQAPLYYFVLAAIGRFIDGAYFRFHILRAISLLSVLAIYVLVNNLVRYLEAKKIRINHEVYRLALLLTIFSPGYLYRASRLSNEILVCILCAFLLNIAIKCVMDGFSHRRYWIMAFVCIACFLTKSTAIYAYAVFGIVAILQRRIKEAILPTICSLIPSIPWFVSNYNTYGSLTAMKEHLDIVIPIVNPNRVPQDLFNAFFNAFFGTFYTGEEFNFSGGEIFWLNAFYCIVLFFVISVIGKAWYQLKTNRFHIEKTDFISQINIVCLTLIVGCILCLTVGTISTRIISLRGRYFYGPSIGLVFLAAINDSDLSRVLYRKYFYIISVVAVGIFIARSSTSFIDRVYNNEQLYGSNIERIEIFDLSDENWTHGYSKFGNYLLLRNEENDGAVNYNALIGRTVLSDAGKAVITDVQEKNYANGERYVWLTTSKRLDFERAGNNILTLGDYCGVRTYNAGYIQEIIGNIEEMEMSQTLLVEEDGTLWGCEIYLATYSVPDYSATVEYKISDEKGQLLQNGTVEMNGIKDNQYSTLYFDEPISVRKDQELRISVTYDHTEDLPITIRVSDNDSYPNGGLYKNGQEVLNQDMGIRLLMQR